MGQKDVERERPLFEGQSAEEFIKRWNAVTNGAGGQDQQGDRLDS